MRASSGLSLLFCLLAGVACHSYVPIDRRQSPPATSIVEVRFAMPRDVPAQRARGAGTTFREVTSLRGMVLAADHDSVTLLLGQVHDRHGIMPGLAPGTSAEVSLRDISDLAIRQPDDRASSALLALGVSAVVLFLFLAYAVTHIP